MDWQVLVAHGIPQGFEFLDSLANRGIDLTAAFWAEVGEEEGWRLHLATDIIRTHGAFDAYRQVNSVLNSMGEPKLGVNDVKLIDSTDPLVQLVRDFQIRHSPHAGMWTGILRDRGVVVRDAYVYPVPQTATAP